MASSPGLADLLTYPPRDSMPALLIFGATGDGQDADRQKFLRDHRSTFDEGTGVTRWPAAYVQMPPVPAEWTGKGRISGQLSDCPEFGSASELGF